MPVPRPPPPAFLRPPLATLSSAAPTSAYIHLPFCAQRCAYCAFPVIVSGRSALPHPSTHAHPAPSQSHHDYVDLLCREIRAVAKRWPSRPNPPPLSTLYLGGGTPSLLHPDLLRRLIHTVRTSIGIAPAAELTCEMDPATFSARTARAYRALGVNRASVGAQSFDDRLLAACRRIHNNADIHAAVAALRQAGFSNISLDLISALPGQTIHSWRASLEEALPLHPEHISSYDLTLEPGTAFGNKYTAGEGPLPSDEVAADMMNVAAAVLADAGYEHYEVSNFAKRESYHPGPTPPLPTSPSNTSPFRSQHNMAYWRNEPFYAFGLGATSLVDGFRFARPRRLSSYTDYVNGLTEFVASQEHSMDTKEQSKRVTDVFYPHATPQNERERLEDYLINSFRLLVEGVNLHEVRRLFGQLAWERLVAAIRKCHFLETQKSIFVQRSGPEQYPTSIRLTQQGAVIENSVLSTLLEEAVWRYPVER